MGFSFKFCLAALFIVIYTNSAFGSIGGYISPSDRKKFIQILTKTLIVEGDDISTPYYGVRGLKLVEESYDKNQAKQICTHLKKFKLTDNLEAAYNAFSTWFYLNCEGKLESESIVKDIKAILDNDKSTIANVRYAVEILSLLKIPVPSPAKVAQVLQSKLKNDDSLLSVGHVLHAASLLGDAGKFAQDRIEDVSQADEIDGKLLQWEGGLTITSLLVTGLFRVAGSNPFTVQQADKLANYLLTRTTVQNPKGLTALLEATHALATSKVSPISISFLGSNQLEVDKPELKIQISNIFGQPLKPSPSQVVVQSVKRINDNAEVLSKLSLTPDSNPAHYILKLNKLEPGHYNIEVNAGSLTSVLPLKVLGPITINYLEIGLSDADGSLIPKLSKLSYPAKLSTKLQADSSQQLIVKFSVTRPIHQAFVRLFADEKEIIFVAEQDSSKIYKVEINLANELSQSGTFEIELILGDSLITNPIRWTLGSIDVNLGLLDVVTATKIIRGPKPEIKHLFRPAEKRPPETVSLFFTGLTVLPFVILLILWGKLGVNFSNFTLHGLPFHLGFGAILGLFTLFWLKLDMFSTCAWLIPIGGFTFFSGHKLLCHIAGTRLKKEKADK